MRRWLALALTLAATAATGQAVPDIAPLTPDQPIERRYYEPGPFAVAQSVSPGACDGNGNQCDFYYPAQIAATPGRRPIVMWANGTAPTPVDPATYAYFLRHLASWGFVVVASRDGATATGETVLSAARYTLALDQTPGHPFFGRLAADRIGVMGHSQGATGAIHALLKSNGLIRSAVAFNLPQQQYCNPVEHCFTTAQLKAATQGSIFFLSSHGDSLISPDVWPQTDDKLNSNTAYYEATPDRLTKLKAMLVAPSHNDIQGKPACDGVPLCVVGVYRHLGYPTAWMLWQLGGSDDARAALRPDGEIARQPLVWTSVRSNVQ